LENIMAISLSGERSLAAATPNPFVALTRWIAKAKAARTRRNALYALLELDHDRLSDIGISRDDITTALSRKQPAGAHVLSAARARNARL
jgi:uncharacterized protein YjiS (DUF1127 family)|tara:strand:+ start:3819 stop:4088 length:270 start_codon:yes stop_codon:yes gene_type:complete